MTAPPIVAGTRSRGVLSLVFGVLSVLGVLSLVLGILSFLGFSILTGIPAWIIAHGYIKDVEAGRTDPAEIGMAKAGKILGFLSVAFGVVGLALFLCAQMFLRTVVDPQRMSDQGDMTIENEMKSMQPTIEATIRREDLANMIAKERNAHP